MPKLLKDWSYAGNTTLIILSVAFSSTRYVYPEEGTFSLVKNIPDINTRVTPAQDLRAAVLALRAFNVETGLIGENVREQTLAQIRMQWWREAVNGMYRQTPHEHPIIQALTEASCLSPDLSGCLTWHQNYEVRRQLRMHL